MWGPYTLISLSRSVVQRTLSWTFMSTKLSKILSKSTHLFLHLTNYSTPSGIYSAHHHNYKDYPAMKLIQNDSTVTSCNFQFSCLPKRDDEDEENRTGTSSSSSNLHRADNDIALADHFGLDHMRLPFPYKLHILLCDMETTGREHIISWVEDGKAFKIHQQQQFETLIQPRYFRQSKISSFIRQCYMYGFSKIDGGSSLYGSYIHPYFQRDNQEQALSIHRRPNAGFLLRKTKSNQRHHHHDSSNFERKNGVSSRHSTTLLSVSSAVVQGGRRQVEPIIMHNAQVAEQLPQDDTSSYPFAAPCMVLYNNNLNCRVEENNDSFFASLLLVTHAPLLMTCQQGYKATRSAPRRSCSMMTSLLMKTRSIYF